MRTNFLSTATITLEMAFPMEMKVIWHDICIPKMKVAPIYILSAFDAYSTNSLSGEKTEAKRPGKICTSNHKRVENDNEEIKRYL